MYDAAWLIGLPGVIAWTLSAATGRNGGLGITTPSAHTMDFITTGDAKLMNWGALLVLGLLIGSCIAGKATGEFRIRVADAKTIVGTVGDGMLMGVGTGTKLWLKPSAVQTTVTPQNTETYSTSESLDHNISNENPSGNSIDTTP